MFTTTYLAPLEALPAVKGFWKNVGRSFSMASLNSECLSGKILNRMNRL
jgi:hypothetical protein